MKIENQLIKNTNNYGIFYYDRGRWNGPAYGTVFEKQDKGLLENVRRELKKKVRFGQVKKWSLI